MSKRFTVTSIHGEDEAAWAQTNISGARKEGSFSNGNEAPELSEHRDSSLPAAPQVPKPGRKDTFRVVYNEYLIL